ncbi:MAG: PrgI family protein [Clostridiales bacterium]|nr:PrgI family protein [Clostridiales bacterium]
MTEFVMPIDITGEEKMIGGVLSLRQIGYMAISIVAIFFLAMIPFPIVIKVIGGVAIFIISAALGFLKIDQMPNLSNGMSADKYLMLMFRYKKMQKIYRLEVN